MRRRWLVAALALFAALVLVLPAAANARVKPLFAAMAGPGHQGGGSFTAVIDNCASPAAPAPPEADCPLPADRPWFCYGIALKDLRSQLILGGPYRANVEGASGLPVIGLNVPLTVNPGSSNGCVRLTMALAEAIAFTPPGSEKTRYYVEIRNLEEPFWAARGQIFARAPPPVASN